MIGNARQQLLLWIAQYGFLCVSQLQQLGLKRSSKTIRSLLRSLRERHLIDRRVFQFGPEIGRVEDMHYLLPKGKKYLMRELELSEEQILLPRGPKRFHEDYRHRKMTINVHIALRMGLSHHPYQLLRSDAYFCGDWRGSGNRRQSATTISTEHGSLKADLIISLGQQDTSTHLWCIELHRGQRVLKIYEQRRAYVQALRIGSPSTKYRLEIPSRVLTVFEHESTLHTAIERTQHDPLFRHLTPYFLSIPYDCLESDALHGWRDLLGQKQSLIAY